jgi:phage baseplate assembly protein gpV/phage protein D
VSARAVAAVEVSVDGESLPAALRILSVRVANRFGAPTQCEVALHDVAGPGAWPQTVALGARLSVRVVGEDGALFAGEVTCVQLVRGPDGTTVSRVRAYDALHRLRKRQTLRVFESVTAGQVAAALVADLDVTVADPDDGPRLPRVVQHRQRDFDLLVEVAARTGRLVTLDGTILRLSTLEGYGDPIKLHYGQSLYEATVEANLDGVADTVTAYGWDSRRAEVLQAQATQPRTGRRGELRAEGRDGVTLVDQPATGLDDVTALAQSALDAGTGRAVTLRGVADGDARLRPGVPVDVTGIGPSAGDGRYVLCSTVHTLDGDGYRTAFSTEAPALPVAERGTSLTLGRVTAVDDPDGLGRIRVSLPAHGDLDAGWLAVLCPGAGRGKGLVALPDVDDTVAVALPHGEPAAGVVLGSLFGTLTPPDTGVEGNAVTRWSMHTADGQSIVVDDTEHSVRVANRGGSFVELTPDLLRLHASSDLVVEAPGKGITIRAGTVDFQQA